MPYNISSITDPCPLRTAQGNTFFEKFGMGASISQLYTASGEDYKKQILGGGNDVYAIALSQCLDASQRSFQLYSSGTYSEPACTDRTNHCISFWGFGTDNSNEDYWVLRNSWGVGWGMDGYMHLKRGVDMCGVGVVDAGFFSGPP